MLYYKLLSKYTPFSTNENAKSVGTQYKSLPLPAAKFYRGNNLRKPCLMALIGFLHHQAVERQLVNTAEGKQPGLVSTKIHNFMFQIQSLSHCFTFSWRNKRKLPSHVPFSHVILMWPEKLRFYKQKCNSKQTRAGPAPAFTKVQHLLHLAEEVLQNRLTVDWHISPLM